MSPFPGKALKQFFSTSPQILSKFQFSTGAQRPSFQHQHQGLDKPSWLAILHACCHTSLLRMVGAGQGWLNERDFEGARANFEGDR